MKPDVIGSRIFGGVVLAVLVVLHWWAFRIGEKRRRKKLAARAGAGHASKMTGDRFAEDPALKAGFSKRSSNDLPIPPPPRGAADSSSLR